MKCNLARSTRKMASVHNAATLTVPTLADKLSVPLLGGIHHGADSRYIARRQGGRGAERHYAGRDCTQDLAQACGRGAGSAGRRAEQWLGRADRFAPAAGK